jgi:hypothetical protein
MWTRRRVNDVMSDDFDAILDRCLADIAAGREMIDSCLRRYPAQAGQLSALLGTADRARALPLPAPLAANKRRALESRLLRRAEQLRSVPASRPTVLRLPVWRRRVALALATFVISFLLLSAAVSASASSVPGDFLYPVKRTTEQVRLALVPDEQQVDLHLEFARQRLQELRVLTARGEISENLLGEISGETALMLEQIPKLPQEKQQALLLSLTDFQDQNLQTLEVMASSVQGDMEVKVMTALADSVAKRQRAIDLLTGAASGNNPADGSPQGPRPTIEETRPPEGKPTVKPESTEKPKPTPKSTKVPPVAPQKPTPKVEHTPPGQAKPVTPYVPSEKPTKTPKK